MLWCVYIKSSHITSYGIHIIHSNIQYPDVIIPYIYIYIAIYLLIYLSMYPPIYLSIYLSIKTSATMVLPPWRNAQRTQWDPEPWSSATSASQGTSTKPAPDHPVAVYHVCIICIYIWSCNHCMYVYISIYIYYYTLLCIVYIYSTSWWSVRTYTKKNNIKHDLCIFPQTSPTSVKYNGLC